jgi:hypothetical protein
VKFTQCPKKEISSDADCLLWQKMGMPKYKIFSLLLHTVCVLGVVGVSGLCFAFCELGVQ